MSMDITEAIRRAEQWRKDGACGPTAVVAIALLNELQRMQYEHNVLRAERVGTRLWTEFDGAVTTSGETTLDQAQSKANDDMLAAQRNLLLREDGYPNAPVKVGERQFVGPAHMSAMAIREQWFKQKLGE